MPFPLIGAAIGVGASILPKALPAIGRGIAAIGSKIGSIFKAKPIAATTVSVAAKPVIMPVMKNITPTTALVTATKAMPTALAKTGSFLGKAANVGTLGYLGVSAASMFKKSPPITQVNPAIYENIPTPAELNMAVHQGGIMAGFPQGLAPQSFNAGQFLPSVLTGALGGLQTGGGWMGAVSGALGAVSQAGGTRYPTGTGKRVGAARARALAAGLPPGYRISPQGRVYRYHRRYSIGSNPRMGTLIKVGKKVKNIVSDYTKIYTMFGPRRASPGSSKRK